MTKSKTLPTTESEISALVEKRVETKLRKIEEMKADEESAKQELKAALISCLSEMNNEQQGVNPSKKQKTVNVADTTNAPAAAVSASTIQNMPVVVSNCQIIRQTGKNVTVSPFTPDYTPMTFPVVDVTILY